MRLLGNKTRLLPEIEGFLRHKGISGGTFIDIFCGTARVGRHFKQCGFRVLANDWLPMCYTKAVAEVEVNSYPTYRGIRDKYQDLMTRSAPKTGAWRQSLFPFAAGGSRGRGDAPVSGGRGIDPLPREAKPLADVLRLLTTRLDPVEGLIFQNYCPGGQHGRRYFTNENGKRIDGVLTFLRENFRAGRLSEHELHLLISSLLDAADRVANISGTYGAFLKQFQSNAKSPLLLRLPEVVRSSKKHRAFRADANELVADLRGDVLYVDPPYNTRQYAANYHVPGIIAEYHSVEDLDAYEKSLYGKTGLLPYENVKSAYCSRPSGGGARRNALSAMTELILSTRAQHVLISYNEEGLLSREDFGHLLALFEGKANYDFDSNMRQVLYRRFRSDSDRPAGAERGPRRYKVIEGKNRDEISEWLLFATRGAKSPSGQRRRGGVVTKGGVAPGTS